MVHNHGNERALGFYSLSFSMEDQSKIASVDERSRHPNGMPILYIGYLGVRRNCQGNGLGKILLMNALKRCHWISTHVAYSGVGIRPLDDRNQNMYESFGFGVAPNEETNPLMILPVLSLNDLFG